MSDARDLADRIAFTSVSPKAIDEMNDLSAYDRQKLTMALQDYVDHPDKSEGLKERAQEGIDYFGSDDDD